MGRPHSTQSAPESPPAGVSGALSGGVSGALSGTDRWGFWRGPARRTFAPDAATAARIRSTAVVADGCSVAASTIRVLSNDAAAAAPSSSTFSARRVARSRRQSVMPSLSSSAPTLSTTDTRSSDLRNILRGEIWTPRRSVGGVPEGISPAPRVEHLSHPVRLTLYCRVRAVQGFSDVAGRFAWFCGGRTALSGSACGILVASP